VHQLKRLGSGVRTTTSVKSLFSICCANQLQIGRLNLLTPTRVAAAGREIKTGEIVPVKYGDKNVSQDMLADFS